MPRVHRATNDHRNDGQSIEQMERFRHGHRARHCRSVPFRGAAANSARTTIARRDDWEFDSVPRGRRVCENLLPPSDISFAASYRATHNQINGSNATIATVAKRELCTSPDGAKWLAKVGALFSDPGAASAAVGSCLFVTRMSQMGSFASLRPRPERSACLPPPDSSGHKQPPSSLDMVQASKVVFATQTDDRSWRPGTRLRFASRLSCAGREPRGRCAPRTPCSRRRTGGCPRASVPAPGWTMPPGNAGRAIRTAWCPRIVTAP
jgi:hypothetical protein